MPQSTKGCARCSPTSSCTRRRSTTDRARPEGRAGGRQGGRQVGATTPGGPAAAACGAVGHRDLDPADRVVIRALPSSRYAISARLEQQLRAALNARAAARRRRRPDDGRGARVIFLIQLYRNTVSPLRLPTCRFTPTCSQYAVEALTEYGLIRGGWLAVVRLAKCGPWHRGGWDPIPERREQRSGE